MRQPARQKRAGSDRAAGRRPAGRSVPTGKEHRPGKNTVLPESLRPFGTSFRYGKNAPDPVVRDGSAACIDHGGQAHTQVIVF
jgi:hypothetical protein